MITGTTRLNTVVLYGFSGADLISYGMGEHSIVEIADALESGIPVEEITYIPGTVYKCKDLDGVYEPILLPSFDEVKEDKKAYAESFAVQYENTDPFHSQTTGRILWEQRLYCAESSGKASDPGRDG